MRVLQLWYAHAYERRGDVIISRPHLCMEGCFNHTGLAVTVSRAVLYRGPQPAVRVHAYIVVHVACANACRRL